MPVFTNEYYIDDDLIVTACHDPHAERLNEPIWHPGKGGDVIKYSPQVVVKFGYCVTPEEARNQEHAFNVLDPNIIRVPKVLKFFSREEAHGQVGYLVMEYVEGELCAQIPSSEQLHKIADGVNHMHSFACSRPGPVGGGYTDGFQWDDQAIEIVDKAHLEKHWNDRLFTSDDYTTILRPKRWGNRPLLPVSFQDRDLVLTHCNIMPRNIIFCNDGTPTLLDWNDGGYYPRTFEHVALDNIWENGPNNEVVNEGFSIALRPLLPLSEDEKLEVEKLHHARNNAMVYKIVSHPKAWTEGSSYTWAQSASGFGF